MPEYFTSFAAAAALKKYSGSCVCSQLAQNSVYTVDMGTARPKYPSHMSFDDISVLNDVTF